MVNESRNDKSGAFANFSLTDFLAYLFPGAFGLAAIVFFICIIERPALISLSEKLPEGAKLFVTILAGSFGVAMSYILGLISSSFVQRTKIEQMIDNYFETRNPYMNKHLKHLLGEIDDVLDYFFGKKLTGSDQWKQFINVYQREDINRNSGELFIKKVIRFFKNDEQTDGRLFYSIRAIVRAEDQGVKGDAERQSSLRQSRRNLFMPLLLWLAALYYYYWPTAYILVLLAAIFVFLCYVIFSGIRRNREFEVRDCFLGAWWLYKRRSLRENNTSS